MLFASAHKPRGELTDADFLAGREAESAMPLRVATSCQSGVSALWRQERRKRWSSFSDLSILGGMVGGCGGCTVGNNVCWETDCGSGRRKMKVVLVRDLEKSCAYVQVGVSTT